jgi:hypothetical protein
VTHLAATHKPPPERHIRWCPTPPLLAATASQKR